MTLQQKSSLVVLRPTGRPEIFYKTLARVLVRRELALVAASAQADDLVAVTR